MISKTKKAILVFFTIFFTVSSIASPAYAQAQQGVGQGTWWFPLYSDFLDKEREKEDAKNKAAQAKAASRYKSFLQEKEDARKQIQDLTNQAIDDETARAEAVALTKKDRDIAAVKGTAEQKASTSLRCCCAPPETSAPTSD